MIDFAPFTSEAEHRAYCDAAKVPFEEGSVGFKIFDEDGPCGLVGIKFVGNAAYLLQVRAIERKISSQVLANALRLVLEFLRRADVQSVVYPITAPDDVGIAESAGFDRLSDTLYAFDFPASDEEDADPARG